MKEEIIKFIKEQQDGVLLNDYTIDDMIYFMKEYHEYKIKKEISNIRENPSEPMKIACKDKTNDKNIFVIFLKHTFLNQK